MTMYDTEILAAAAIDLWRLENDKEAMTEFLTPEQITALNQGLIRADARMGYPS